MRNGFKIILFGLGVGLLGGIIIGYIILGKNVPAEQVATVALIIAILTWFGSGTEYLGILRDWLKEQREKDEKREQTIAKHTSMMMEEMRTNKLVALGSDWINRILDSRHHKRILQHLFTSKRDIFDFIDDIARAERQSKELRDRLNEIVIREIRAVDRVERKPMELEGFAREVMAHMSVTIGTDGWKSFSVIRKGDNISWYYSIAHQSIHHQFICDQKIAEQIAERLNNLVANEEVCKIAQQYQANRRLRENCDQILEGFISDLRTGGNVLRGACEGCISNYDKKEIKEFKEKFGELEKTTAYKEWFNV